MANGVLNGSVGKLHHVGARGRRQIETAGQVEVEDVEAARAQFKLPRLDVDDDLVADRDRTGEFRVRDAGLPVDFTANEAFVLLRDRRDGAAAKAKSHRARPG